MKSCIRLLALGAMGIAATASAIPIGVSGTLNSLPVNASGSLVAGAGVVTVTLNNLQADPKSIIQCISGLSFDVSGASGSGLLSTVNSGEIITIASGGSYSSGGTDPLTRWKATETGNGISLTTLSGGNPDRLIIGPPGYANANPSILGDNPSVLQTATFTITVPGVSENSEFGHVLFKFGTDGSTVNVPDGGATAALLAIGMGGLWFLRRRLVCG